MDRVLKNKVDTMCNKIDTIGRLIGRNSLRDDTVSEMIYYLMYLSVADGDVEWAEVRILNQYLGTHFTPADVQRNIELQQNMFFKFQDEPPQVFTLLVDMDKQFCKNGVLAKPYVSELMIAIYRELGREIVHADSEFEMEERIRLSAYLNMLQTYREKHLSGD